MTPGFWIRKLENIYWEGNKLLEELAEGEYMRSSVLDMLNFRGLLDFQMQRQVGSRSSGEKNESDI